MPNYLVTVTTIQTYQYKIEASSHTEAEELIDDKFKYDHPEITEIENIDSEEI